MVTILRQSYTPGYAKEFYSHEKLTSKIEKIQLHRSKDIQVRLLRTLKLDLLMVLV